jgi:hypothetical protein
MPSSRRSIERCGCSAPQWLGKPPRVANARGSWANRPATASTPTSTSITQTRLRGRARSLSPPQRCCGPCRPPRRLRCETYTARCSHSSSRQPSNRPRARRLASANRATREVTGPRRGANPRSMQVKRRGDPPTRDARRPKNGSSTRAGRWTATPVTSSTLGGRARRMRGRRQATTLGVVGATTATKIALRRRSPRDPCVQPGDPRGGLPPALPPAHNHCQVQRGHGSPRVAQ